MTDAPTRGGKRTGAGRPITGETATEPRTVTLLPHHWAMLEQQNDNVSAALRDALDRLAALESAQFALDVHGPVHAEYLTGPYAIQTE